MLFLVDSSIYIFRAWQGLPTSIRNRFDEPDNAVQGLAETLCGIIETHQPSHMVCAFDECFRQGIRNKMYAEYKADRPPAPEDLAPQFARCKQLATAMGIPCFGSDQVEADDIIGQFAALASSQNIPVTIVSGDKDLAQFITPADRYWDLGRRPIANYQEVHKRFKVRPEQMADWLALCGDKSDNIPGVPGVGPSTAARLLNKWQTLDNLLSNLGEVAMMGFRGAPRVSRLLFEHKETIRFARTLTGMIRDDRLPSNLDATLLRLPESAKLQNALHDVGLPDSLCESLSRRISKATLTSS
ncbi:MAG: 5'-3' exonuclease H3TH domain-containing protein [Granulosicoccus sp.]